MPFSPSEFVLSLSPSEIFVFGSNLDGFHGAGSAGFASFNRSGNIWREEGYGSHPTGWKGYWNVKGIGEGPQTGTHGSSYALPTVTRCGAKRSRSPHQITESIRTFYNYATTHPHLTFLVAGSTSSSLLNGYSHQEMASFYLVAGPIPANVHFSSSYTSLLAR